MIQHRHLPERLGSVRLNGLDAFDSESIANNAPNQWRWLSLPQSRLVLNPTAGGDFAPLPRRPDLPLHIGYYAGRQPHRLLDLVTVGVRPANETGSDPSRTPSRQPGTNIATTDNPWRADGYRHVWHPHMLAFTSEYEAAGAVLSGRDFFADENTVVRLIERKRSDRGAVLQLHGTLHGRACVKGGSVLVEQDDFFYAVSVGQETGRELTPSLLEIVLSADGRQWHVDAPLDGNGGFFAAVGFSTRAEGAEAALRRVSAVVSGRSLSRRLAERKVQWDGWLRAVPAPERFGIEDVDPRGVTPQQHRQFYYGAWAFVISNVLPVMPENDYPYPQSPCGKPSLWNFGASKAPASAAWESFFGQQMLAYVMPDVAWPAFEGIIAQVDESGWLDGECLPSRKAQTAWILYSLTGDAGRLQRVYPAIKRYLFWREKNPRWIYLEHDRPDEKDASFVDQLLVDIDFASRIAQVIGLAADVDMWRQRRDAILRNYREWFFFTDGRPPAEYYFTESGRHDPGNANWVVSGLHIPDLPPDLASQLKDLYRKRHRPDHDLCGMGWTKYGTESFTAYGLIEHGMHAEAREFINAQLRDQILAGEFAENYAGRHGHDSLPRAWGVKPSLFGAAQMIDFTCMNNGVRLDQGRPQEVRWPDAPPVAADVKGDSK